jgi:penicillin-binding protein 2
LILQHDDDHRQEGAVRRILILRLLFVGVFILYGLRLFNMQIISGKEHEGYAQDISRRTEVLPSQRGEIYDRSYTQPLALNVDSFAVSIVPA